MRSPLAGRLLPIALALALWPAMAAAITFDEALGLAARAPRVTGAGRAVAAKLRLDEGISSFTFNPQLAVQPGFRFYPSEYRDVEVLAELSQPFNLAGHARARRATARLEEDELGESARAVALEQRLGAARAWIDLWAAQRVFAASRRDEQLAVELERLAERAAAASAATRADVADAQAFLSEARVRRIAAEGEVFERGMELSREAALVEGAATTADGELPEPALPPQSAWPSLIEHAGRLPDSRAQALRARAGKAREVEERAARGSWLQLGLVAQRDAPGGLVGSVLARVSPSVFDRGERERGVFAAEAERLEGERANAAIEARADVAIAAHEVEHTGELLAVLSDALVPASRAGADLRQRIFDAGEATMVEVLQARRIAVDAASRLARARAAHAWARVKLYLLARAIEEGR